MKEEEEEESVQHLAMSHGRTLIIREPGAGLETGGQAPEMDALRQRSQSWLLPSRTVMGRTQS